MVKWELKDFILEVKSDCGKWKGKVECVGREKKLKGGVSEEGEIEWSVCERECESGSEVRSCGARKEGAESGEGRKKCASTSTSRGAEYSEYRGGIRELVSGVARTARCTRADRN